MGFGIEAGLTSRLCIARGCHSAHWGLTITSSNELGSHKHLRHSPPSGHIHEGVLHLIPIRCTAGVSRADTYFISQTRNRCVSACHDRAICFGRSLKALHDCAAIRAFSAFQAWSGSSGVVVIGSRAIITQGTRRQQ